MKKGNLKRWIAGASIMAMLVSNLGSDMSAMSVVHATGLNDPAIETSVESTVAEEPAQQEEEPAQEQASETPEETEQPSDAAVTGIVSDSTSTEAASDTASSESSAAPSESSAAATEDSAQSQTGSIKIAYTAGEGGMVSLADETVDLTSGTVTYQGSTATAADGYKFVNWTDEDEQIVSEDATFVPADLTEDTTYVANFEKDEVAEQKVTVTYEVSPKGSTTVAGEEEVTVGDNLTFTVKPGSKYTIGSVHVADKALTTTSDADSKNKAYTIEDVTKDLTVSIAMETAVSHPAFHDEKTVNGITITLDAAEGVLPAGVSMEANEVTSQVEDGVKESLDNEEGSAIAYDITLIDEDGNTLDNDEWSGNGYVTVNFSGERITAESEQADQVKVLHVDDQGNVQSTEKTISVAEDESVSDVEFNAEHFSTYVLWFYKNNHLLSYPGVTFYT